MSEERTKEELLQIWRRDLDPGYTIPLEQESEGRGLDVISGLAALLARASEAVQVTTQSLYLKPHSTQLDPPASGGVKSTGTAELRSATPADSNIVILSTALGGPTLRSVQTSPNGDEVLGPVFNIIGPDPSNAFPAGSVGPFALDIEAAREGVQGNVSAGRELVIEDRGSYSANILDIVVSAPTVATVRLMSGGNVFNVNAVGQYLRVTEGANAGRPAALIIVRVDDLEVLVATSVNFANQTGGTLEVLDLADLGITATIPGGTSGGRNAELDLIGKERNAARAIGETDEQFRDRLCNLADRVSPNAIIRAAEVVLDPAGVDFQFIEVRAAGIGMAFFPLVTASQIGHAFDDPNGYRKGLFFSGGSSGSAVPLGFLIVVDGEDLPTDPAERDSVLSRLVTSIFDRKGGGVPWVIAFEPPIP